MTFLIQSNQGNTRSLAKILAFLLLVYPVILFADGLSLVKENFDARDIAYAAYKDGDLSKSLNYYSACLEVSKRDISCLLGRGGIHYIRGDYRLALADYEKAIQLDNSNIWALEALAIIFKQTSRSLINLASLEELALNQNKSARLFEVLGDYFLEVKDFYKSENYFARAVELDSNNPFLRAKLAFSYEKNARFTRALAEYKSSQKLAANVVGFPKKAIEKRIEYLGSSND